jgi:hypothetical protein
MEFASLPGCGRSVVATRAYLPGEVIHEETAYVMAPCIIGSTQTKRGGTTPSSTDGTGRVANVTPQPVIITNVCIACFSSIKQLGTNTTQLPAAEKQQLITCASCASQYCSEACFVTYSAEHSATGECCVLRLISNIRHKVPKEDFNTFVVACLVCAKANYEGFASHLLRECHAIQCEDNTTHPSLVSSEAVVDYEVETVGLGMEPPLKAFYDVCMAPQTSTFEHMEHLVTNRSSMDAEIRGDFDALYKFYEKLRCTTIMATPAASIACSGEGESRTEEGDNEAGAKAVSTFNSKASLLPSVSCDVFASICCAFLANGFGLWNAKAVGVATGFFPRSSFFNHSCAPNIGREMVGRRAVFFAAKHISCGEAICLSYIDFKLPKHERLLKLKATYTFDCCCPRCSDPDAIDHRERYDLALCQDCKSKVLRPEVSENPCTAVCPCCRQSFSL